MSTKQASKITPEHLKSDHSLLIHAYIRDLENKESKLSNPVANDVIGIMTEYYKPLPAIVIDTGSGFIKAGFAGNNKPSITFPSIYGGRHPHMGSQVGMGQKGYYIGDEALRIRGVLRLQNPITNGYINDSNSFAKMLKYTIHDKDALNYGNNSQSLLHKLDYDYESLSDTYVLLTEPASLAECETILCRENERKLKMEIMFERFDVNASFLASDAVLSLYASGRTTGCVLQSGAGLTSVVPIFDGYQLSQFTSWNIVRGIHGDYMKERLMESLGIDKENSYCHLHKWRKDVAATMIKEQECYVAMDYSAEKMRIKSKDKTFELPDGKTFDIRLGPELIDIPEMIVTAGIYELSKCIESCDKDLRSLMYGNIVLAGGNTMFKGLPERIEKEMKSKVGDNTNIEIIAPENRPQTAWIGGSILASSYIMDQLWITKEEWKESGIAVVKRKCLMI